jgi:hypothetical protein
MESKFGYRLLLALRKAFPDPGEDLRMASECIMAVLARFEEENDEARVIEDGMLAHSVPPSCQLITSRLLSSLLLQNEKIGVCFLHVVMLGFICDVKVAADGASWRGRLKTAARARVHDYQLDIEITQLNYIPGNQIQVQNAISERVAFLTNDSRYLMGDDDELVSPIS